MHYLHQFSFHWNSKVNQKKKNFFLKITYFAIYSYFSHFLAVSVDKVDFLPRERKTSQSIIDTFSSFTNISFFN